MGGTLVRVRCLLPLFLMTWSALGDRTETLTHGESEDICPCLPMDKCPRIYGQSATDTKELGFLQPCSQFGTVRCCGVTIRIEHEKDFGRISKKLENQIGYETSVNDYQFPGNPSSLTSMDHDLKFDAFTTHLPSVDIIQESLTTPTGNPLMKLRRRKIKKANTQVDQNNQILSKIAKNGRSEWRTTGTIESSDSSLDFTNIEKNSPTKTNLQAQHFTGKISDFPSYKPKLQKEGEIVEIQSGKKSHFTIPTDTLHSTLEGNLPKTSKANPVFSRVRKPIIKVGIKVDANLPATVLIKTKSKEDSSGSEILSNLNTQPKSTKSRVVDMGINIHERPLTSSNFVLSSQIDETNKLNSSTKLIQPSGSRLLSSRNNSSLSKLRPILIHNNNSAKTKVNHISTLDALNTEENRYLQTSLSNENFLTNSKFTQNNNNTSVDADIVANVPHIPVKVKRPARPGLKRRPIEPKLSPMISNPMPIKIPFELNTSTLKLVAEIPSITPASPKLKKRVRIHRYTTTTIPTTTQYLKNYNIEYPKENLGSNNYQLMTHVPETFHASSTVVYEPESFVPEKDEVVTTRYDTNPEMKQSQKHTNINYNTYSISYDAAPAQTSVREKPIVLNQQQEPTSQSPLIDYSFTKSPQLVSFSIHQDPVAQISLTTTGKPQFSDDPKLNRGHRIKIQHFRRKGESGEETPSTDTKPSRIRLSSTYTKIRDEQEIPQIASTTDIIPMQPTTIHHRFPVPTHFNINRFVERITEKVPTHQNAHYGLDENLPTTGDNYDMVLNKEVREYLKNQSPHLHSYYNTPHTADTYRTNDYMSKPQDTYIDHEAEEETRIHLEFVENSTAAPSSEIQLHQNVQSGLSKNAKYRRIPVYKPGHSLQDTRRSPLMPSSKNKKDEITIVNSEVLKPEASKKINEGHGEMEIESLGSYNFNLKQENAEISSNKPLTTSMVYPQERKKFNFPPFNSRLNSETESKSTLQPSNSKASNKIGFRFSARRTTLSPPTSVDETTTHQKPTESSLLQQIPPTDIPVSPMTPVTSAVKFSHMFNRNSGNVHTQKGSSLSETPHDHSQNVEENNKSKESNRVKLHGYIQNSNNGYRQQESNQSDKRPMVSTDTASMRFTVPKTFLLPQLAPHTAEYDPKFSVESLIQPVLQFAGVTENDKKFTPNANLISSMVLKNEGETPYQTESQNEMNTVKFVQMRPIAAPHNERHLLKQSVHQSTQTAFSVPQNPYDKGGAQTLYENENTESNASKSGDSNFSSSSTLQLNDPESISRHVNQEKFQNYVNINQDVEATTTQTRNHTNHKQQLVADQLVHSDLSFTFPSNNIQQFPTPSSNLKILAQEGGSNGNLPTEMTNPSLKLQTSSDQISQQLFINQQPATKFHGTTLFNIGSLPSSINPTTPLHQQTKTNFSSHPQTTLFIESYQNGYANSPHVVNSYSNRNNYNVQPDNFYSQKNPSVMTKYSSNQFNPYGQFGRPIKFAPEPSINSPHYIKEYHQHHAISKQILSQLRNSVRISRSANLTAEDINSLLEISKSDVSDEELLKKMKMMNPLLKKLDICDNNQEECDDLGDINVQKYEKDYQEVDAYDLLQSKLDLPRLSKLQNKEFKKETLSATLQKMNQNGKSERNSTDDQNMVSGALLLNTSEEQNKNNFRPPKAIQRGFFPIVPYSEQDPGPLKVIIRNPIKIINH